MWFVVICEVISCQLCAHSLSLFFLLSLYLYLSLLDFYIFICSKTVIDMIHQWALLDQEVCISFLQIISKVSRSNKLGIFTLQWKKQSETLLEQNLLMILLPGNQEIRSIGDELCPVKLVRHIGTPVASIIHFYDDLIWTF